MTGRPVALPTSARETTNPALAPRRSVINLVRRGLLRSVASSSSVAKVSGVTVLAFEVDFGEYEVGIERESKSSGGRGREKTEGGVEGIEGRRDDAVASWTFRWAVEISSRTESTLGCESDDSELTWPLALAAAARAWAGVGVEVGFVGARCAPCSRMISSIDLMWFLRRKGEVEVGVVKGLAERDREESRSGTTMGSGIEREGFGERGGVEVGEGRGAGRGYVSTMPLVVYARTISSIEGAPFIKLGCSSKSETRIRLD